MNKKFLTMAAAAMMFAACSDELKVDQSVPEIAQNTTEVTATEVPIEFGAAYVNRATTRSGLTGTLTTGEYTAETAADAGDATVTGLKESGFGVFGYYTNAELYVAETYKPNFMYNTRVFKDLNGVGAQTDEPEWTYSPVRYWPNEFGISAVSDDVDRVSFFAYAPYVSVNPSTGSLTNGGTYEGDNGDSSYGIIGMSRNTASGDPYIKYQASLNPATCVDLTYGVAAQAIAREGLSDVAIGGSMLNLSKPSTNDKLKFTFKHALAALNVQIDAAVDALTPSEDNPLGMAGNGHIEGDASDATLTKTRIYVRSISFDGLTDKGMLNLRDANWYDMTTGNQGLSGTLDVYDGRNNGREAIMAATNEMNVAFNADIVQVDDGHQNGSPVGVTNTPVNLFQPVTPFADPANPDPAEIAARLVEPIYVIPTGLELRVTIVYDIETWDDNLPGYLSGSNTHGISVENAVTQTVSSGFTLQKGQFYTLKLHLGVNSVKYDVEEVDTWPDSPGVTAETSLPANIGGTLNDLKDIYTDYEEGGSHYGDSESDKATKLAQLRNTYVGKYIDANGTISSAQLANSVGRIAYMAPFGTAVDANAGLSNARILVMALSDAKVTDGSNIDATSFPWWNEGASSSNATWGSLVTGAAAQALSPQNLFGGHVVRTRMTENANWNTMDNKYAGYDITYQARTNASKDYAFQAAINYKALDTSTAGVGIGDGSTAVGKWFLPTVAQMIDMGAADYMSNGANGGDKTKSNGGPYVLLSGSYWSSSEFSAAYAWLYNASLGYFINYNMLSGIFKVRPCFAY